MAIRAAPRGGQRPAEGAKAIASPGVGAARLPERVGARQRGVAAEVDLRDRREPPQAVAVAVREEEGRLGQVHLRGQRLHPRLAGGPLQQADRGRVAGEGARGEGVDLVQRRGHHGESITSTATVREAPGA